MWRSVHFHGVVMSVPVDASVKWRRLWPYLAVLDTLIALLVVANLVASFWTGTWFLLDLYLYPEDFVASAWICYFVGNVMMLSLTLVQSLVRRCLLSTGDEPVVTWRTVVVYKVYTYVVGLSVVFQWRGIAYVSVILTGMSVESAVIGKFTKLIAFYVFGLKGPPGTSSNRIVRLSVSLSVIPCLLYNCNILRLGGNQNSNQT